MGTDDHSWTIGPGKEESDAVIRGNAVMKIVEAII
jgi:hypothetical protein